MTALQLRAEPDDLAALVDAAARARGLPQAFVEKAFWVIEVLRAATAHDARVVSALSAAGRDGVAALVDDIGQHSAAAGFPFTERPAGGHAGSRASTPDSDALSHMQSSYDLAARLIYGPAPALEECLATARTASHLI